MAFHEALKFLEKTDVDISNSQNETIFENNLTTKILRNIHSIYFFLNRNEKLISIDDNGEITRINFTNNIDLEIRANISFDINKQNKLISDSEIRPDLVIHKGNQNREGQYLIGEIKINKIDQNDIEKIITYKNHYKYQLEGGLSFIHSIACSIYYEEEMSDNLRNENLSKILNCGNDFFKKNTCTLFFDEQEVVFEYWMVKIQPQGNNLVYRYIFYIDSDKSLKYEKNEIIVNVYSFLKDPKYNIIDKRDN